MQTVMIAVLDMPLRYPLPVSVTRFVQRRRAAGRLLRTLLWL
jgi:hypothetical protein